MKDPAFLFYPQDFLTGTMFFNDAQIGIYIKLLCAQHQLGGIIAKDSFNSIVGENSIIRSKFIETEDGFFNQRLMEEIEKRSIKSTNLSANAKIRWDKHKKEMQIKCKSNANASKKHMPIEDENVNENENVINVKIGEIKNLCKKENSDLVLIAFEKWKDYLQKQHSVSLLENKYTYDILIDAIKRVGEDKIIDSIDFSIHSNFKKIYPNKAKAIINGNDLNLSIDERKRILRERAMIFEQKVYSVKKYSKSVLKEFLLHWVEPNESFTQMRFEQEEFWSLEVRLEKWASNQKSFAKKPENNMVSNFSAKKRNNNEPDLMKIVLAKANELDNKSLTE